MANLVEFLVKLNDMASGPLKRFGSTGQSVFTKLGDDMNKVSGKSATLGNSISQLDSKLKQLESSSNRANNSMGNMFRTGLAIAGIGSLAFLGKDIMQAGIGRQMDLTALQTLLGTKNGNSLNAQLVDFAKKSIYGNEVFNEGKLMAGSGIAAGNIMPIMRMIGDIAMGDKERMKSIALAFSEASTRGSLTGINERMFLQGGLFNPIEQLHKMTGRSLPDLKKDMEKGKISIDMLVQAMQYATGPMGRWHNMMQRMQETPAGKWTAFTGTLRTLAGTIGLALLPALGHLTDFLTGLINNEDALVGIALAIGAMTAAWVLYTGSVQAAALWTGILEARAMWPIAAGAAIGIGIAALILDSDKLANATYENGEKIWSLGNTIRRTFEDILYWIQVPVLGIESVFQRLYRAITTNNFRDMLKHFGDDTGADKKLNALRNNHVWNRAMDLAGKDKDGNANKGKTVFDAFGNKYTPAGAGADGGTIAGDTSAAISGGGVRNITINVAKFQDKTEIHTASFKESVAEAEDMLRQMFLRITNSAATALN